MARNLIPFLALVLLAMAAPPAACQTEENIFNPGGTKKGKDLEPDERLKLSVSLETPKVQAGGTAILKVTLDPAEGFHTYPFKQEDPNAAGVVTSVRVESSAVTYHGEVKAPPPHKVHPAPEFNAKVFGEYTEKVEAQVMLRVKPEIAPGTYPVKVRVSTQICDDSGCVPIDKKMEFQLEVTAGTASSPSAGPVSSPPTSAPQAPPAVGPTIGGKSIPTAGIDPNQLPSLYAELLKLLENPGSASASSGDGSVWAFILSGAIIGFVSLLTPCVFPMIPITVSFFLKQSERENHRPVATAAVYCGTIILVLTLSAMFLLGFMQALSQNPYMNFFIGLLFVFFALSLFGWYDIELPSSLTRFTSSREGQGGFVGTIFMALTFTIISFACVAPFLGGFAGAATAARPWHELLLGALAFSITFASPFFLLALFPGLLRSMPKSGSWLNSVKVVMGFLELAAALKFLRAGELALMQGSPVNLFTYDLVLAGWIGISLLCCSYLLGGYRLPHDSPVETLSVPRLLWAGAFLGLAVLMLPALWKAESGQRLRPAGEVFAWLDAFLLDEPRVGQGHGSWSGNLKQSLEAARAETARTGQRRLVFIDFTGIICTNCRFNEHNIFPDPRVQELFKKFELVQLVTDTLDTEGDANKEFQKQAFGTIELPLYVIVEPLPDGRIKRWGQMGGKINSVESFAEFLSTPLAAPAGNGRLAGK